MTDKRALAIYGFKKYTPYRMVDCIDYLGGGNRGD